MRFLSAKQTVKITSLVPIPFSATFLFICVMLITGSVIAEDDKSPIKVQVSGASNELVENLKVFLPSLRHLKCNSTPRRVERFIDASTKKLLEGAEAMGYFNGQFSMTSQRKQGCWILMIDAKPGATVKVEQILIKINGEGSKLAIFRALHQNPPYQVGDVFVSQAYEDFKAKLKSIATRLGFFDATFERHHIHVDLEKNTAGIELVFSTGKRYRLGEISVKQDVLDKKHQARYIHLKQGDKFDSVELIEQQRLLENSQYYKNVEVRAGYQHAKNGVIPITITAPRRKRYTYKGAIGYATDDGVYIETGVDTHWLNDKGHQLNLTTRFSAKDPAFTMKYKIPLWEPEHEYATLSSSWKRSDNDDIRGTALELGFSYHRRNDSGWEQVGSLTYLDEETEIDGNAPTSSQLTLLGGNINKTERNHVLFPTKGWRLRADLKGAVEGVISHQSVLQAEVEGKFLHSFGDTKSVNSVQEDQVGKLILQGGIGTTFVGEFDEMPKSLRFFAGGQNSVRGYSFENLGETDDDGDVIGGKHKLTMSIEYEHPVMENLSAAIFVDAGNAFNNIDDFTLEAGYGVGVRYKSPLGPIRVDLAVPEDNASDVNLYFSLGPDL